MGNAQNKDIYGTPVTYLVAGFEEVLHTNGKPSDSLLAIPGKVIAQREPLYCEEHWELRDTCSTTSTIAYLSSKQRWRLRQALCQPRHFHLLDVMMDLDVLPNHKVFKKSSESVLDFVRRKKLCLAEQYLACMTRIGYGSIELTPAKKFWLEASLHRLGFNT